MNIPSVDIKDMIEAAGLGTFGTDLFISTMPDTPDFCIALYDLPGPSDELNYEWEYHTVQVQVRGKPGGYPQAYQRIYDITKMLHGKQTTINGARYALIQQEGGIGHVTTDDHRRPTLSTRFLIQRTSA